MFIRKIDVEGEFEILWTDVKETGLLSFDIIDTIPNIFDREDEEKVDKEDA